MAILCWFCLSFASINKGYAFRLLLALYMSRMCLVCVIMALSLLFIDHDAQQPPHYANIFETDNYVYFTYTEPALETFHSIGSQPATFSRIVRVCKNDRGRGDNFPSDDDAKFKFATLFKARMVCGTPGVHEKENNNLFTKEEYKGYYANYVNEIGKATSLMSFYNIPFIILKYIDVLL